MAVAMIVAVVVERQIRSERAVTKAVAVAVAMAVAVTVDLPEAMAVLVAGAVAAAVGLEIRAMRGKSRGRGCGCDCGDGGGWINERCVSEGRSRGDHGADKERARLGPEWWMWLFQWLRASDKNG